MTIPLLAALDGLPAGLLVACSGGRDSVCLLHACINAGLAPVAMTVDHGLSAYGAQAAAHVARLCAVWSVPHVSVRVTVSDGAGPEDAARQARYAALFAEAERLGVSAVALAHTADDQIETVLMRLVDGAGSTGLAGMPSERGVYRRPWLTHSRASVAAYARENEIEWCEDPTNAALDYRRNRVRHLLLPAMEATFGRGWATGILRSAALSRLAAADQTHRLRLLLPSLSAGRVEIDTLLALAPGDRRAALLQMCAPLPARRRASAVDTLSALLARAPGTVRVDLPGAWHAERAYGWLAIHANEPDPTLAPPLRVDAPGTYHWGRWRVLVGDEGTLVPGRPPFEVRARRQGERFRPQGAPGSKSIARLLINAKVPRQERDRPVVCDRDGIVWVPPLAVVDGRSTPAPGSWRWRIELS